MAKKKDDLNGAQKIGIGIGLTAAAVAAAGTYFLYGSKDAAKNRKQVRSWALKAKAEVLEALEKAEEMSKDEYEQLVDVVSATYAKVKETSPEDIEKFKKEMKAHWKHIEKVVDTKRKVVKKVAKKATKTAKKAAKKVTKKAAPKKAAKKTVKKAAKKTTKKK